MAALDNIYSGFNLNKNFNSSYTGPLFRVWSRDSGSLVTVDIEQNASGEPDLVKFQNEQNLTHDWGYDLAYDQWGNTDWDLLGGGDRTDFIWTEGRYGVFWDSATQSFSEDADGLLGVPTFTIGDPIVFSVNDIPIGTYSIYVRQQLPQTVDNAMYFMSAVGNGNALHVVQGSSDTDIDTLAGDPTYYIDAELQNFTTTGEAWTAVNETAGAPAVISVVGFDTTVVTKIRLFQSSPGVEWDYEYYSSALLYNADTGAQSSDIQALFSDTVLTPKVTFTDESGSPIVGGHVLWIEETAFTADSASWNSPVIVESTGVTDANGEVTYGGTVDPAKVYTAVLRDYDYVSGSWVKSQGSDTGQQNVDLTAPA